METELLQSLEDVGYDVSSMNLEKFKEALEKGPKSVVFTSLVAWLTDQLVLFGEFEEKVHATEAAEDASSFLLELSLFLKELGCIDQRLMSGNVNQRLANEQDRILLLEFLITELMASKIIECTKPKDANKLELTIRESDTAKSLKDMLLALNFPEAPDDITTKVLYEKLESKLNEIMSSVPGELVGKPLFTGELSPAQWEKLWTLREDTNAEYKMRREMLLKRLDCTVQSFMWSDRIKPKEDQLNVLYHDKRNAMTSQPCVTLANLLAARDDVAIIEKMSNATVRKNTRSNVNNVIIGAVPDRGGRPQDQEPPPPEMPSWQKDRAPDGPSRGGRGRGGGGGRGGYRDHKDALNNFGQNRDGSQYSGGQGNYHGDNRGGEYQRGGGSRGGGRGRGGRVQGGWNQRGRAGQHY